MPGTVLENLSGRKLLVLTVIWALTLLTCFLLGGLFAPAPSSASSILATKCFDSSGNRSNWFYPRGKGGCHQLDHLPEQSKITDKNIVFAFQLPLKREGVELDFSRWQQNLIGILTFEIHFTPVAEPQKGAPLLIDARLGYRNKGDSDDDWKLYSESKEVRALDCTIDQKIEGFNYQCNLIPLFELGSLHHDFYLLNVWLPTSPKENYNKNIGKLEELYLVTIHQNGGFTKVWFSIKTVFTFLTLSVLCWNWHRIKGQSAGRPPALLEKIIIGLAISLEFLNIPIEWLTIFFDLPFMLLLSDIRQGIFYASLLSFWLVFAGEHLMESGSERRKNLRNYWMELSFVLVGCFLLFLFDLCERGTHLVNPFYSLWSTSFGSNFGFALIVLAGFSACSYFIYLVWMVYRVFRNISTKRNAIPSMSSVRRMHYEGIIYRFRFLMISTLICAAMTVIGFILGQVTEESWKWVGNVNIEYTSAFYTGVYGMWNVYIIALLCLYAPSHKNWPPERDPYTNGNSGAEEIEFTRLEPDTTEISALTSFAKKVAAD